jgi:two-component system KDP operon response regulator KdpE
LRHSQLSIGNRESVIHAGPITIDIARHIVTKNGEELKLAATEFKLFSYLASHPDHVLTHQAILTHVWGFMDVDRLEYLRVYIGQLRKKVEADPDSPKILLTDPGIGYRFKSQ